MFLVPQTFKFALKARGVVIEDNKVLIIPKGRIIRPVKAASNDVSIVYDQEFIVHDSAAASALDMDPDSCIQECLTHIPAASSLCPVMHHPYAHASFSCTHHRFSDRLIGQAINDPV